MIKVLCLYLVITTVVGRPEPPVNSYLPPSDVIQSIASNAGSAGGGGSPLAPSADYGVPGSQFAMYGVPRLNGDIGRGSSGGRPATSYGIPSVNGGADSGSKISSSYNAPGFDTNRNTKGGATNRPSPRYGAPGTNRNGVGASTNGKGNSGSTFSTYDAQNFGGSNGNGEIKPSAVGGGRGNGGRPSLTYGPSNSNGKDKNLADSDASSVIGSRPADSYGPPASGSFGRNEGDGQRNQEYLPPNQGNSRARSGGNGNVNGYDYIRNGNGAGINRGAGGYSETGGSNEPAKYEFSYQVEDAPSGLSFGHSEMRDGDFTTGQYNVLLPDGRKQVVEYKANQEGFRPEIRYEGAVQDSQNSGSVVTGGAQGYDYQQNDGGFGGSVIGSDSGQGFGLGYASGRPNVEDYSNSRRGVQDVGANSYSSSAPNDGNAGSSNGQNGERKGNNSGQYSSNGQGYGSGRPNSGRRSGSDYSYPNSNSDGISGGRNGNGGVNGYNYEQKGSNGFGSGGQNGENSGSGYRY